MKRVKYFEKYDERGITGEYGRYFAEILLPYFETNNKLIGNETKLQLESYIYIYIQLEDS